MGTIISAVESIAKIRFVKLKKGEIIKVKEIVVVDDGAVLMKFENGSYTFVGRRYSHMNDDWSTLGYSGSNPSKTVMRSLVSIGAITKEQMKDHFKHIQKRAEEQNVKCQQKQFKAIVDNLGVTAVRKMLKEFES